MVAHELTRRHRLLVPAHLKNESGALNESFSSDGHRAGSAKPGADYLVGEDVSSRGSVHAEPLAFGGPDHYSVRFTGSQDNGESINSGSPTTPSTCIGRHAPPVQVTCGRGASNREQIEKVFYRAFTGMLPPSANFATARAATLQSARDLYGAGGAVERAVGQAWTAVGVQ